MQESICVDLPRHQTLLLVHDVENKSKITQNVGKVCTTIEKEVD